MGADLFLNKCYEKNESREGESGARAMVFFVCICSKLAAGPAKAKPLG
jgi:hypothetical protein